MTHKAATLMLAAALAGCVGEVTISNHEPERSQSALWECKTADTTVKCDAALPPLPEEVGAYACDPSDTRAQCPPPSAVSATPGIDALVAKYNAQGTFGQLRWACLLTGKVQRSCVRDVTAGQPPSQQTPPTMPTDPSNPTPPTQTGTQVTQPPAPTSCDAKAWEPYFAQLSTFEYQSHGVNITFPRELFDTSANFQTLAEQAGQVPANPGAPSCSQGEGGMRQQAWLDAVMQGCTGLNNAILVMCQQAANYAPQQGACAPTGTW